MEGKKHRLTRNHIIFIVAAIAILCLVIIFDGNNNSKQLLVETSPATTEQDVVTIMPTETESIAETLSEEERNQIIRDAIDKTVSDWIAGTISFEEASSLLTGILETSNLKLANYAQEQLTYLSLSSYDTTCSIHTMTSAGHEYFDYTQALLDDVSDLREQYKGDNAVTKVNELIRKNTRPFEKGLLLLYPIADAGELTKRKGSHKTPFGFAAVFPDRQGKGNLQSYRMNDIALEKDNDEFYG